MNPLCLLTFGCYGEALPNQNGAPIRVVEPVEVRLQERQVHRQVRLHRQAAAHLLERERAQRVRLLLQRESAGGPSPLVPGARAPHRFQRLSQDHPHADVQRLRRPGGQPLLRDGPEEELTRDRHAEQVDSIRQGAGARCLPAAVCVGCCSSTGPARWRWRPTRSTGSPTSPATGRSLLLLTSLAVTPVRRLHPKLANLIRFRRCWGCTPSSTRRCTWQRMCFCSRATTCRRYWQGCAPGIGVSSSTQWKLVWPTDSRRPEEAAVHPGGTVRLGAAPGAGGYFACVRDALDGWQDLAARALLGLRGGDRRVHPLLVAGARRACVRRFRLLWCWLCCCWRGSYGAPTNGCANPPRPQRPFRSPVSGGCSAANAHPRNFVLATEV